MNVEPYLFFDGRCEQALEFYKKALGAKVDAVIRYKENPEPKYNPPNSDEKVMHALFRIGDTKVMRPTATARASRASRASRSPSTLRMRPRRNAASTRSPTAARCRCRSARRSSRRASAWSPTASACPGW